MINRPIDYLNNLIYSKVSGLFVNTARWQRYFEPVAALSEDLPAPILGIMVLIWQLREKDLQIKYPLETKQSSIGFIAWCIVSGRAEYRALKEATQFWDALNRPAQFADQIYPENDPAHAISWLMALAAQGRPDLVFDLTSKEGRSRLLAWYILNGRAEMGFDDMPFEDWQMRYFLSPSATYGLNCLQELIYNTQADIQKLFPLPIARQAYLDWFGDFLLRLETEAMLNQPAQFSNAPLPEDDPAQAISKRMVLAIQGRTDLNFDLTTRSGRQQLLVWYLQHGRVELGLGNVSLETWQTGYLYSLAGTPGLNRLQELIYGVRPDVQQAFPLPMAMQDYFAWFRHFLTVETRLIDVLGYGSAAEAQYLPATPALPFGVNIIGYVFGQLGIGEDARMAAQSLLEASVPMTMLDFPPGADVPQVDRSMESYVSVEPKYIINLFCLPGLEQGRYFAERGRELFEGRYNIGYWPWELPEWPGDWQHLLSLVDEVWVSSQYIFDAIHPVSPVPVRIMPMAVVIPEVSSLSREDFALPKNATLFLFAFDLNSSMARKNPKACVSAFLEAFPLKGESALGEEQVGLVIKVHPPKAPNKEWDALKQLQENDPRIHLIEQTLSKPDLLALYNVCDCFVSLHRAEGFGRCIAEAMLLGKPVITTGFSGNLAFTSKENALLVDCKPLLLAENDYPYGQGQAWVEPDIRHAAEQMLRIVDNPRLTKTLGDAGQNTIQTCHNTKTVGMRYANTLRHITLK
ncbi:MAG: glycosyltransferase [Methylovulum sp.]|nr:glycosyltransferase [Methylovulum sp.]